MENETWSLAYMSDNLYLFGCHNSKHWYQSWDGSKMEGSHTKEDLPAYLGIIKD